MIYAKTSHRKVLVYEAHNLIIERGNQELTEKEEVASEASEEVMKWPLPYNIALDKLDKIVKAFFQAQADTKNVSANDLKGRTGLNLNTIKGNTKFLIAIGILKATEDKDSFSFAPTGAEYARALASNEEQKFSALLKELLTTSYLTELVDYIELQGASLTFEQLFQHIKAMARLKEDSKFGARGIAAPYATGISTLIDLLCRAGIVSQDIIVKKEVARPTTTSRRTPQKSEKQTSKETQKTPIEPIQGIMTNVPFTLNITVEAKDPESIKQLINLLKELKGQTREEL